MEILKDGDVSGWVMNESMDTWVHICRSGWMKAVTNSIEKRVKVASFSSFKPLSYS